MVMKYYIDSNGYYALFDSDKGISFRGGINGENPFWKESGPELLDISITNYCERECSFCYRKSNINGMHMDLSLYRRIIGEAKKLGVFQVALGGGNPNQHPDFIDILRITKEIGIVPSYTTNGMGMTDSIFKATKMYAGAVAVSWYKPYDIPIRVINKCYEYEIPVNIHFILSDDSIDEAYLLLEEKCLEKVNAIIFLNYKPLGLFKKKILRSSNKLNKLLSRVLSFEKCKIGFDSCMISYLMPFTKSINLESIDFCEAARFSAFISEKGMMFPCSFMCGDGSKGYSIRDREVGDIWKNADSFKKYRSLLEVRSEKCIECSNFSICHGGCREFDINCN